MFFLLCPSTVFWCSVPKPAKPAEESVPIVVQPALFHFGFMKYRTRTRIATRTNTNPNHTEANAAGRSGMRVRCANNASAEIFLRGRGIGQNPRKNYKKRSICLRNEPAYSFGSLGIAKPNFFSTPPLGGGLALLSIRGRFPFSMPDAL